MSPDIRVEIGPEFKKPSVIIRADHKSLLVENIIKAVEECIDEKYPKIAGFREGGIVLVNQAELIRVYTENRKVMMATESGDYEIRRSLQDIEELLDESYFVRISRFEIINLKKVCDFDFGISGTIRVTFTDGSATWVARRYVKSIHQKLTDYKKGGNDDE